MKGLKRNERSSNGSKFSNINKSSIGPSFGCQSSGHVVKDCLILKKKAGKWKQKAKKEFKTAILATWGNSDISNSDDNEDQVANPGLMAKEYQVQ